MHTEAFPLAVPRHPRADRLRLDRPGRHPAARDRAPALQRANAELGKFQALVEASRDFIAIAGLDGTVTYLNPGGRALVGLGPDDDVTATTIADYLTAEGLEQSLSVEQPAVREHGSWEGESTLRHLGGEPPVPVAIASFLMHDPDDRRAVRPGHRAARHDRAGRRRDAPCGELSEHRQALLERLVRPRRPSAPRSPATSTTTRCRRWPSSTCAWACCSAGSRSRRPQLLDVARGGPGRPSRPPTERLRALLFDLEAPDLDHGLAAALERAAEELFARHRRPGSEVAADPSRRPTASLRDRRLPDRPRGAGQRPQARRGAARVGDGPGQRRRAGRPGRGRRGRAGAPTGCAPRPGTTASTGMRDRASLAGGEVVLADRPGGGALVSLWLPRAPGQG